MLPRRRETCAAHHGSEVWLCGMSPPPSMRLQTAALHTSVVWQGRRRPAERAATQHRRKYRRGTRSPAATVRRAKRLEKKIHGRERVVLRYRSRPGRHRSSRASRCHLCCVILFHSWMICHVMSCHVSFPRMWPDLVPCHSPQSSRSCYFV